ncbi:hypothetical protein C4D60_Mb04t10020 [Musa balbisiana]|uniref:ER lumen protein-retaining receptor n=1 Tax=Musa balbisiana TaxID=52838 RepID=A0A4S8KB00_MUSBA|nr:hypothetical protein C4D60_Mb04t10020 [Musa balbisiana]
MNAFRFAGDMSHLVSVLVLLLKIYATKSCSGYPRARTPPLPRISAGISLKTQELYALVFLTRYLDLFIYVVSVYNTLMKIVFIASSLAIVWYMRSHPLVRRTYDKDQDTFRHYTLIGGSLLLALFFHDKFTIREPGSLVLFKQPFMLISFTTTSSAGKTMQSFNSRLELNVKAKRLQDVPSSNDTCCRGKSIR